MGQVFKTPIQDSDPTVALLHELDDFRLIRALYLKFEFDFMRIYCVKSLMGNKAVDFR